MAEEKSMENENQLVGFRLGEEEFGLDIMKVQEIIRVPEITKVPKTADFVEGVINLRGDVLPVVDSRKRFGLEEAEKKDSTRIMVVNLGGSSTGLVVDSVSEVLTLEKEQIEPPPPVIGGVESRFLEGVGKLDDGKKLIILLDADNLFAKEEIKQISQTAKATSSQAKTADVDKETEIADEIQLVSFGLADEQYAVEVMDVQEIIRVPEITKVPSAPGFIEGVINLREKIIPIINLRKRFAFGQIEKTDATRILIININGSTTGITVDSVSEVLRMPKSTIDPPPPIISGAEGEYLKGVARLDEGKKLLLLVNAENVLNSSEKKELSKLTKTDAKKEEKKKEGDLVDERQLVSFKVKDEEFGIDIMEVQEIIRMTEITQVPKAPYFVKGVLNLRGGVLPVIDLRIRFDLEQTKYTESNRILVVNVKDKTMGIIVDSVSEVLRLPKDTIEPPPPIVSGIRAQFLEGVGKLDDGKRLIILLNLDKIFKVTKEEEQTHLEMVARQESDKLEQAKPEVEAKVKAKAKVEAKVEVEQKPEVKAKVEVQEKPKAEVKAKVEVEQKPKAKVEVEEKKTAKTSSEGKSKQDRK